MNIKYNKSEIQIIEILFYNEKFKFILIRGYKY